ncbi:uncharacterized protein CELE_C07C7.3 [Caenorhabditis elegans]|uniref:Uncharacterized protein n=1 Tax=Caenorhabditis elegans TaxID=6239 RepID=U4PBY8_CAEEL|nr:Uncharacterized protein CELE_C07C7.3 [Caenorhabditis elegans]CDH93255.1 Uncharacterized protein CELE_C07C7.3 [Caenorhabditis elegans]|eukprot:NP_001294478.1 Uncharacterized protein CELE_C07C7.3 [Caenorhabditis elegans]
MKFLLLGKQIRIRDDEEFKSTILYQFQIFIVNM